MAEPERMETTDLLKKVRAIELRTRGLSNQIFSGEYHSAFKGQGMAFSENRAYQHGDEIRTIDWNVTARMQQPYVKVFEEERELTAIVLADVSASGNFGTRQQLKRQLITELTALIAFSAIQNNDKIGVLLFSDRIEKFIPPKKGKSHILRIIRELINFQPEGKGTDISMALDYLNRVMKKRSICFILSDFMDSDFDHNLRITSRKHDVVALHIEDPGESEIPRLGWVQLADAETGNMRWFNTSSKRVRRKLEAERLRAVSHLKKSFMLAGVDHITLRTDQGYVKPLMTLFRRRG